MRRLLLSLLPLLLVACGGEATDEAPPLPNGMYEVLAEGPVGAALPDRGQDTRALLHDRRYVRGGDDVPPERVLLRTTGYAPLDLASAPRTASSDGRPVLLLDLEEEAARALTELTSRARRAAIVIGGDIVTVHSIREPLRGGALQVSC